MSAWSSRGIEMLANADRARDTDGMATDAQPEPAATPKPKRRWFQYSITSLLLLILVCGAVLALVVNPARRQRRAVEFVESAGGTVTYAYRDKIGLRHSPEWLKTSLGLDFFASVVHVHLHDTQISDAGLVQLRGLALEWLILSNTRISDAGVAHLTRLIGLELLYLQDTQISDAGLAHLKGLTALRILDLNNTQVSDAGVADLQQALPNCAIYH